MVKMNGDEEWQRQIEMANRGEVAMVGERGKEGGSNFLVKGIGI